MTGNAKKILIHKFSRLEKYNNIVFKFLRNLTNDEKKFLDDFLRGLSWKR